MEEIVYCHNRKCIKEDCIRREVYMPFNVMCRRRTFDCSEKDGYKFYIGKLDMLKESNLKS